MFISADSRMTWRYNADSHVSGKEPECGLSEHSSSAVNTAATYYPQGKAEQMVFPSLPPATLKVRDICCSTFVAQGQNLQS